MYAYIKHSGKQFRVQPGILINVDKLNSEVGDSVEITDVPIVVKDDSSVLANPEAIVTCTVSRQFRGKKILVLKQRPKKGYKRKRGHRQEFTQLLINDIKLAN